MNNRILYITHPEYDMRVSHADSVLLTGWHDLPDSGSCHTSLGDMPAHMIITVAELFDSIEFLPEKFDKSTPIYRETAILLTYLSHAHTVKNFVARPRDSYLDFAMPTQAQPTLWVFGCSHSHGVGLEPGQLKFADILASNLDMPLQLITRPGSSTQWSLRHLTQAGLKQNDVVIWQITTPNRFSWANPSPQEVMLSRCTDRNLVQSWNSQQILFHHFSLIDIGVAYLRSKQVSFCLTSIEIPDATLHDCVDRYVTYPEYCYSPGWMQDRGNDDLHAGVLSHRALANALTYKLQCHND